MEVPAGFAGLAVAARNAAIQAIGEAIFGFGCQTLGLTAQSPPVAGDFQSPPSYIRIVRSVMDAAAPNPVIT